FKQAVQTAGGRVIFFYMLMGEWDIASLIEVADDATAARILLGNGTLGNVRTHTMKAFTEEEFRTIIGSL
ncbi:MAG: GYD domain-containing protein, partial [Dehalococcoidia bacterium]